MPIPGLTTLVLILLCSALGGCVTSGEKPPEGVDHAIACMQAVRERGQRWIDVRADVMQQHNQALQARLQGSVWSQCRSWYRLDNGRVFALFPRLGERASNMGNQLSGGEQQMLAIGRALVTNPRLLILDEATEGLAPRIREEIWSCLAQLRAAGQTILVIDKYVERLLGLADRHLILERGKVVWSGDSAALDGDRALWERYLGV